MAALLIEALRQCSICAVGERRWKNQRCYCYIFELICGWASFNTLDKLRVPPKKTANNLLLLTLKQLVTRFGFLLLRGLSFLPLPIIAGFAWLLSPVMYICFGSRRRVVLKNLSACFPDKSADELRSIAKRCFCLTIQTGLATGINWWASESRLSGLTSVTGREHYDQALAEGRNIILLAPHVIALEVGGFELNREGPLITMYQRTKNPIIDSTIERARSRYGGILVERKEPLRGLLKLIRQGKPFYYLPDQDGGRKGVFIPFFTTQASTIPMIGKFASLCDAVVIPCFTRIKRCGSGWVVELGEAIDDWPSDNIDAATLMNQVIEKWVTEHPEQYFWLHKRFKTRPNGEASFYE